MQTKRIIALPILALQVLLFIGYVDLLHRKSNMDCYVICVYVICVSGVVTNFFKLLRTTLPVFTMFIFTAVKNLALNKFGNVTHIVRPISVIVQTEVDDLIWQNDVTDNIVYNVKMAEISITKVQSVTSWSVSRPKRAAVKNIDIVDILDPEILIPQ